MSARDFAWSSRRPSSSAITSSSPDPIFEDRPAGDATKPGPSTASSTLTRETSSSTSRTGSPAIAACILIDRSDDHSEETLLLEFAEGAKMFVPIAKINLVQKYVGGGKTNPPLSKLGSGAWEKRKKRVAEAVIDLAQELIDIQAARASRPGFAYPSEDSHWMAEFEASFPYEETPDQLAAIESVKRDMALAKPMDRLICGDVGYGKTEVAIRAAFKAADAGRQVAVLVPTTILAEQHHRSFSARMAEFPFVDRGDQSLPPQVRNQGGPETNPRGQGRYPHRHAQDRSKRCRVS